MSAGVRLEKGRPVRLYVADAWKPALMPDVWHYYCTFSFGGEWAITRLFDHPWNRNAYVNNNRRNGFLRGTGRIMWKSPPEHGTMRKLLPKPVDTEKPFDKVAT